MGLKLWLDARQLTSFGQRSERSALIQNALGCAASEKAAARPFGGSPELFKRLPALPPIEWVARMRAGLTDLIVSARKQAAIRPI